MGKVLFTISYEINPEHRDKYLALSKQMKEHLAQNKDIQYSIYEQKGKKNNFIEVFLYGSKEEFDRFEEDQYESFQEMVHQLEGYLMNGKMKYTTLYELE
ncbi:MAG TPA: hypothetical protein VFF29_00325 [Bacteroidota bacterium]|nr:hypothetical protein [Bacteroidota bacterium]